MLAGLCSMSLWPPVIISVLSYQEAWHEEFGQRYTGID